MFIRNTQLRYLSCLQKKHGPVSVSLCSLNLRINNNASLEMGGTFASPLLCLDDPACYKFDMAVYCIECKYTASHMKVNALKWINYCFQLQRARAQNQDKGWSRDFVVSLAQSSVIYLHKSNISWRDFPVIQAQFSHDQVAWKLAKHQAKKLILICCLVTLNCP